MQADFVANSELTLVARGHAIAAMVYDNEVPVGGLAAVLQEQSVKTSRINTCHDAARALARVDLPHLVFTDTALPDGTWRDVLSIAARAPDAPGIIVVARFLDIQLYFETIEQGAFDLVMPPFYAQDIHHVAVCALDVVERRRAGRAGLAGNLKLAASQSKH